MEQLIISNPLFFVFLLPILIDVLGTVTGQPKEYWSSHYKIVSEAAPVFFLLRIHPLVFIVGTLILWLPVTYIAVDVLPTPFNLWAAMTLFATHSYNSVHWLRRTQWNLGILKKDTRGTITLSLLPMIVYLVAIGYVASWALQMYWTIY